MELPLLQKRQERVVIVGGGFAGIHLAKKLSSKYFQIILIDKNNYHQFQPLLYQVATGGLEPSSISFPLRKIFQPYKNVFIRIAEVQSVEAETKKIKTGSGTIDYDYLVFAHGATTNFFGNKSLEENAYSMKSVSEALLLRNTLLQNYEKALVTNDIEEKEALLNVIIVGGGPTGVELAGAIAEMRNKVLPRDYAEINFAYMHIYLLEASSKLLSAMSESSSATAQKYLNKMGVEVVTHSTVEGFNGINVLLNNDKKIRTHCLIWAAGVKGHSFPGIPVTSLASNQRILVDAYNEVKNMPDVFAIGDASLMLLPDYPRGHAQIAPVAIQQATLLAKNLKRKLLKQPLLPFIYADKGTMATIGKNAAVVEIKRVKLTGFFAWFIWMAVHLFSIIGVKNRLFIFINWLWQYFIYDSSLRLIIKASAKKDKRKNIQISYS